MENEDEVEKAMAFALGCCGGGGGDCAGDACEAAGNVAAAEDGNAIADGGGAEETVRVAVDAVAVEEADAKEE